MLLSLSLRCFCIYNLATIECSVLNNLEINVTFKMFGSRGFFRDEREKKVKPLRNRAPKNVQFFM